MADTASELATHYGIPDAVADIRTDIDALIADLTARHLVEPGAASAITDADTSDPPVTGDPLTSAPPAIAPPRVPSWANCLLRLAIVHAMVRLTGLRRTLRLLSCHRHRSTRARRADDWLYQVVRRLEVTCLVYPFGAECLERSVCLLWLAGRYGYPVQLRLGFQMYPFAAHAWIECEGRPVNDTPEYLTHYTQFPPVASALR